MEEDLILQQPTDRRLGNVNALPPGPPGAEFDTVEFDSKKAPPKAEKESISSKSSRRRSPSNSPRQKRKSPSRSRRTPSPIVRRRRSRSPRRNRFFSPDRRRYDNNRMRRSPLDRRRGGRDRDRYGGGRGGGGRGLGVGRDSRSRSASPRRGGGGAGSRWSPKKKPNSPPPTNVPPPTHLVPPPSTAQTQAPPPQTQYGVMPPQMYGGDGGYGATPAYNQYTVPPPQAGFVPQPDAYGMQAPAPPTFNAAYPPPPAWGVSDAYAQQSWMQQPVPDHQNQMQQMPPQAQVPPTAPPQMQPSAVAVQTLNILPDAAPGTVDPNPAHDAVAQEAENQRDELKKQRSSYLKKTSVLKKELKMLKEQRKDLNSGGPPPSPTTKGFIDENEKLQNQIQKKISTIENVIDMLTGIIGEDNFEKEQDDDNYESDIPKAVAKQRQSSNSEQTKKKRSSSTSSESSSGSSDSTSSSSSSSSTEDDDDDSSPERLKNKAMESMKAKAREANLKKDIAVAVKVKDDKVIDERKRFNYVFYDPEMHWCQTCDIFPKTAKDFLNHLHTKEHMDRESIDTPWHLDMITDQYPAYDNAPTKRTPIRGLTFFAPATAWFCKLCSVWMGDLHCASTHLKSQVHSNKYNAFLEKNPHFEVNWLADRQRVINEKKSVPLPPQITSVSTTAGENGSKKSKKDDEKSKKRKKKSSDKKDKKKKKKRSKKRKKAAATTSSSSSSESSSESSEQLKKKKLAIVIKDLDNPNPAASIRVAMRKQESVRVDDDLPPPPPRMTMEPPPVTAANAGGRIGKWTVAQETSSKAIAPSQHFVNNEEDNKRDDAILQQWNTVQPVISESEKKLLEQLKGKLKNKPREESSAATSSSRSVFDPADKDTRERNRDRQSRGRSRDKTRRNDGDSDRVDRRRRSRSPFYGGGRGGRRGGGRDRSRTRSRGRNSSLGRRRRSRSRSLRRRSRSFDRRRRFSRSRTRSRSRSQSGNRNRIEKAVVRHSEFRPRVPEKEKEKDKKTIDAKEKKEKDKKAKSSTATATSTGKKLPFIGKMPVFKKQTTSQNEGGIVVGGYNGEKRTDEALTPTLFVDNGAASSAFLPAQRPPAPTAAQIQMAMMEDAYGNAPPFHPDASMMVDYDDLMPDPVQFVNIMGQAPPPPPPATTEPGGIDDEELRSDNDMLPPGIDEMESEEFVPKPISDGPMPRKGPLPKDLEEALNIIFPGEKKPGEDDDENDTEKKSKASSGQTQIITDEPVMQAEDLVKEGIHLVTIEETSLVGMDEASQLSMNEPLVFNKPSGSATSQAPSPPSTITALLFEDASQNAADIDLNSIKAPPIETPATGAAAVDANSNNNSNDELKITDKPVSNFNIALAHENRSIVPRPDDIPMPEASPDEAEDITSAVIYDLDDIPQPPASPTESEKNRRQEELNDLAMLGIDADDMAAQCI